MCPSGRDLVVGSYVTFWQGLVVAVILFSGGGGRQICALLVGFG
jgi:hypothetical protein